MIHPIYLGGDFRPTGTRHSRVAGNSNPIVRYAGHLPTRHWILPFHYDGASSTWVNYANMEGKFATGDELHTQLLSASSRIDAIVFNNKKAVGIFNEQSGAVETPAKIKIGLYDGETMVAETDEIDLSVIGFHVLEFGNTETKKKVTKDTDNDGKITKSDKPQHVITSNGAYLANNGTVRVTVVDGSNINMACFSILVELVDFYDERGCSCAMPPCEVDFNPQPLCPTP